MAADRNAGNFVARVRDDDGIPILAGSPGSSQREVPLPGWCQTCFGFVTMPRRVEG